MIHGQVIEAWLPFLKVTRLVVVDDVTAGDAMAQAAMGLAVPDFVEVRYTAVKDLDAKALAADSIPTLLLFREVSTATRARAQGLPNGTLTLGNVHDGPDRRELSPSVFLSDSEAEEIAKLAVSGMKVVLQAVPSEPAVGVTRAA